MEWIDIAGIIFVCVTMNHLGLIGKLEEIMGNLPILNCPKCSCFWVTLIFGLQGMESFYEIISVLAISFLSSYLAIWLELLEGYIDTLYLKLYGKIYKTSDDAPASATDGDNSAGAMP